MVRAAKRRASVLALAGFASGCTHDWDVWSPSGTGGASSSAGSVTPGTCPNEMELSPPTVGGVCVDRIEVTTAAFDEARQAVLEQCEAGQSDESTVPQLPVAFVSECEARAYCDSRSKRLCTVNEWRQACNRMNVAPNSACNVGKGTFGVQAASTTCVNTEGVTDLIGNLWEWVCDGSACAVVGGDASQSGEDVSELCGLLDSGFGASIGEANYVGFRCCAAPSLPSQ